MPSTLENPFYYLDNFQQVLEWVAARDADLLAPEESAFLDRFPRLPQPARALCVRMAIRKGELFRASKLQYPEIGDPLLAIGPLVEAGWVEPDPVVSIDELFSLLTKTELRALFPELDNCPESRKDEQLQWLRARHAGARPYRQWHGRAAEPVWRLRIKPWCERLRLMFFGNLNQDWSEFVLADLGRVRYEQVPLASTARGFQARPDLDHYMALHACRTLLHDGCAPAGITQQLPAPLANPWLEGRRQKLLFLCGRQHERLQQWDEALACYRDCSWPGARARAIRVLEKQDRPQEALALLAQAQAAPEDEAERQQLARVAPRLARQLGLPAARKPRTSVTSVDLRLPPPPEPMPVEYVVRAHLAQCGAPVFYVENTLANALFGLLCWGAIFAPVAGAFFHPFQRGPADLYASDFVARRRALFSACLAELDDGRYQDTIRRTFAEKNGVASPFVHWDALSFELIELALACIAPRDLRLWCERILADVRNNRCGFPDLIQFWPEERRYAMIEVKGPGDRLQDNQLRWISYCGQHGLPVSVCYLAWDDTPAITPAMPAPAASRCG